MLADERSSEVGRTRRALIGHATLAAAAIAAAGGRAVAAPAMRPTPGGPETRTRTALHQEVEFKATPARVYEALLSAKAFSAFTGMPARIDPRAGGEISLFGGLVMGRNIELIQNKRIVQAWRPVEDFPPGVYSLVKMDFSPKGSGTRLVLDHTGFPEGHFDHLNEGWPPRYWTPLRQFLG